MMFNLPLFQSDNDDFLTEIEVLIRGIVAIHQPQQFLVVRINNWFGSRWLRFAGKAIGALGIRDNSNVVIPPFVQNRITAQSLFERSPDRSYICLGEGPNIHHDGPSSQNLTNRAKHRIPGAALFWFSGASELNGRGSLMGYIPTPIQYWGWYIEFVAAPQWHVAKRIDIHENEVVAARAYAPWTQDT